MPKKKQLRLPTVKQLPSGTYFAKAYAGKDVNGKDVYQSFSGRSEEEVLRALTAWKLDKRTRDRSALTPKKALTLDTAIRNYIDARSAVLSPTTIDSYHKIRRIYIQSIMQANVYDLTQEDIQRAINADAKQFSPKTVRNASGFLSAVLRSCRPDFRYTVTLPQREKNEIEIPTEEEVRLMIEEANDTILELPIVLGALCGLRLSEVCGLRWSDVDWQNKTIHVGRASVYTSSGIIEKQTKTTDSTRTIKVSDAVMTHLEKYRDRPSPEGDDHITARRTVVHAAYYRFLDRFDVKYNYHSLRHYLASVMVALDVPKLYITRYFGHNSDRMINQVYAHLMPSKQSAIDVQLNDFFNRTT